MAHSMADDRANPPQQRTVLLATDNKNSVLAEVAAGRTNHMAYSAYGQQSAQQEVMTRLGFNGELREAQTSWYLLGNGYRAYNPRLMRFHRPDSWSPFGRGGLNPYMYCMGDPVNRSDPTGHWGILALLSGARGAGLVGYFTSTIGTGLNLGHMMINRGRLTLSTGLGMISGVTGVAAGLSAMAELAPRATQLLSATSLITGAGSTYLGYRSLRASFRHTGWYEAPFSRPRGSPPSYFSSYPSSNTLREPSTSPVYPLNSSTTLPPVARGEAPPAYSMQDPALHSRPNMVVRNSNSPFSSAFSRHTYLEEPGFVHETIGPLDLARVHRNELNRFDGLPPSMMRVRRR